MRGVAGGALAALAMLFIVQGVWQGVCIAMFTNDRFVVGGWGGTIAFIILGLALCVGAWRLFKSAARRNS